MAGVQSLVEIAAGKIPIDQKEIHDRDISALKNIQFFMLKKFDRLRSESSTQHDALNGLLNDVHRVVSCRAKDEFLYELIDDIWNQYDEIVYILNLARTNVMTNIPNYTKWSYISSRIMVCPLTNRNDEYTDENYHMFESCYQRWDLYGKMDGIECGSTQDSEMYEKINDYFVLVRMFIDKYRSLYKDDRKNVENLTDDLNSAKKRLETTVDAIFRLSSTLNRIDTIITDHTSRYFCINCGNTIVQSKIESEPCCQEMDLILDW